LTALLHRRSGIDRITDLCDSIAFDFCFEEQDAMQASKTIVRLFEDEPVQWGLRGDPYLWREMKATLSSYNYPGTEEQLTALLEQIYQQLTGRPLTNPDPIFVERYSHGGMSSGYVSPSFWAEKAIPLLRARYRDTP
jgi:hypothetical protein